MEDRVAKKTQKTKKTAADPTDKRLEDVEVDVNVLYGANEKVMKQYVALEKRVKALEGKKK
jgi:chaperonin cofactor prefoldin